MLNDKNCLKSKGGLKNCAHKNVQKIDTARQLSKHQQKLWQVWIS